MRRIEELSEQLREKAYIDPTKVDEILKEIDGQMVENTRLDQLETDVNAIDKKNKDDIKALEAFIDNFQEQFNDIIKVMDNKHKNVKTEITHFIDKYKKLPEDIKSKFYHIIKINLFEYKTMDRSGDYLGKTISLKENYSDDTEIVVRPMEFQNHANWRYIPLLLNKRKETPILEIEPLKATYSRDESKLDDHARNYVNAFLLEYKVAEENLVSRGVISSGKLNENEVGAVFHSEYTVNGGLPKKIPLSLKAYLRFKEYKPRFKHLGTYRSNIKEQSDITDYKNGFGPKNGPKSVHYFQKPKLFIVLVKEEGTSNSEIVTSSDLYNWTSQYKNTPTESNSALNSGSAIAHYKWDHYTENVKLDGIAVVKGKAIQYIRLRGPNSTSDIPLTIDSTSDLGDVQKIFVVGSKHFILLTEKNNEKRIITYVGGTTSGNGTWTEHLSIINITDIDVHRVEDSGVFQNDIIIILGTTQGLKTLVVKPNEIKNIGSTTHEFTDVTNHNVETGRSLAYVSIALLNTFNSGSEPNFIVSTTYPQGIQYNFMKLRKNSGNTEIEFSPSNTTSGSYIGDGWNKINNNTDSRFSLTPVFTQFQSFASTDGLKCNIIAKTSTGIMIVTLTVVGKLKKDSSSILSYDNIGEIVINRYTDFISSSGTGIRSNTPIDYAMNGIGKLIMIHETRGNEYDLLDMDLTDRIHQSTIVTTTGGVETIQDHDTAFDHPGYDKLYNQNIIFTAYYDGVDLHNYINVDFHFSVILGKSASVLSEESFNNYKDLRLLSSADFTIEGHGNISRDRFGNSAKDHPAYNVSGMHTMVSSSRIDWGKTQIDEIRFEPPDYNTTNEEEALIAPTVNELIEKFEEYYIGADPANPVRSIPFGIQLKCHGFIIVKAVKYVIERVLFVGSGTAIDEIYFTFDRNFVLLESEYTKDEMYLKKSRTQYAVANNMNPVQLTDTNTYYHWHNYVHDIKMIDGKLLYLISYFDGMKTKKLIVDGDTIDIEAGGLRSSLSGFEIVSDERLNSLGYYKNSAGNFVQYDAEKSGVDDSGIILVTPTSIEGKTTENINNITYNEIFKNGTTRYIFSNVGILENKSGQTNWTIRSSGFDGWGALILYKTMMFPTGLRPSRDHIVHNEGDFSIDGLSRDLTFKFGNNKVGVLIYNVFSLDDDKQLDERYTDYQLEEEFVGFVLINKVTAEFHYVDLKKGDVDLKYRQIEDPKSKYPMKVLSLNDYVKYVRAIDSPTVKDFIVFCDKNYIGVVEDKNSNKSIFVRDKTIFDDRHYLDSNTFRWLAYRGIDRSNKDTHRRFIKGDRAQYFIDSDHQHITIAEYNPYTKKTDIVNQIAYSNIFDSTDIIHMTGDGKTGTLYFTNRLFDQINLEIYRANLSDGAITKIGNGYNSFNDVIKLEDKIVIIPKKHNKFLILDTKTHILTEDTIDLGASEDKFFKIIQHGDVRYCIPNTYTHIVRVNSAGTIEKLGSTTGFGISDDKFMDAILVSDRIYLIPKSYSKFVIVDTTISTIATMVAEPDLTLGLTDTKFAFVKKMSDNNYYVIPDAENGFYKIDTTANSITKISLPAGSTALNILPNKFKKCVMREKNDGIYIIPDKHRKILYINNSGLSELSGEIPVSGTNSVYNWVTYDERFIVFINQSVVTGEGSSQTTETKVYIANQADLTWKKEATLDFAFQANDKNPIGIFHSRDNVIGLYNDDDAVMINLTQDSTTVNTMRVKLNDDKKQYRGSFLVNNKSYFYYRHKIYKNKPGKAGAVYCIFTLDNTWANTRWRIFLDYYDYDHSRLYIPSKCSNRNDNKFYWARNRWETPIAIATEYGNDSFIETVIEPPLRIAGDATAEQNRMNLKRALYIIPNKHRWIVKFDKFNRTLINVKLSGTDTVGFGTKANKFQKRIMEDEWHGAHDTREFDSPWRSGRTFFLTSNNSDNKSYFFQTENHELHMRSGVFSQSHDASEIRPWFIIKNYHNSNSAIRNYGSNVRLTLIPGTKTVVMVDDAGVRLITQELTLPSTMDINMTFDGIHKITKNDTDSTQIFILTPYRNNGPICKTVLTIGLSSGSGRPSYTFSSLEIINNLTIGGDYSGPYQRFKFLKMSQTEYALFPFREKYLKMDGYYGGVIYIKRNTDDSVTATYRINSELKNNNKHDAFDPYEIIRISSNAIIFKHVESHHVIRFDHNGVFGSIGTWAPYELDMKYNSSPYTFDVEDRKRLKTFLVTPYSGVTSNTYRVLFFYIHSEWRPNIDVYVISTVTNPLVDRAPRSLSFDRRKYQLTNNFSTLTWTNESEKNRDEIRYIESIEIVDNKLTTHKSIIKQVVNTVNGTVKYSKHRDGAKICHTIIKDFVIFVKQDSSGDIYSSSPIEFQHTHANVVLDKFAIDGGSRHLNIYDRLPKVGDLVKVCSPEHTWSHTRFIFSNGYCLEMYTGTADRKLTLETQTFSLYKTDVHIPSSDRIDGPFKNDLTGGQIIHRHNSGLNYLQSDFDSITTYNSIARNRARIYFEHGIRVIQRAEYGLQYSIADVHDSIVLTKDNTLLQWDPTNKSVTVLYNKFSKAYNTKVAISVKKIGDVIFTLTNDGYVHAYYNDTMKRIYKADHSAQTMEVQDSNLYILDRKGIVEKITFAFNNVYSELLNDVPQRIDHTPIVFSSLDEKYNKYKFILRSRTIDTQTDNKESYLYLYIIERTKKKDGGIDRTMKLYSPKYQTVKDAFNTLYNIYDVAISQSTLPY